MKGKRKKTKGNGRIFKTEGNGRQRKEADWLAKEKENLRAAADDNRIEDEIQRRLNENLPEKVDISAFLVADSAEMSCESEPSLFFVFFSQSSHL
mgnify:CR=1 FL=1